MKLVLFFTDGVSLATWAKVGMIDREIKPYNQLADFFETIYLITYGDESDLQYAPLLKGNIKILPKKSKLPVRLYGLLLPFYYRRELKDADIYKTNQMLGSWTAVIAKLFYRKKLVVRCGYQLSASSLSWDMNKLKRTIVYLLELVAYRAADALIFTSEEAKDYAVGRYKIKPEKITVISNSIDINLFRPAEAEKTPHSIIYVGRLEKEKNLFSLLNALIGLETRLTIYGSGSLHDGLKALADKNNLKVDFRGNIANNLLSVELNKHELFVLCSLSEGNSKVMLEAMSCGLPVVGTRVSGIKNIIRHGETGYLCETDAPSLHQALKKVLEDKDLAERMGRGARQYIEQNCSLETALAKEKIIYQQLIK